MNENKEIKKDNIHKGHRERVRKRFLKNGVNAFDDHELLELLLFYVHRIKDTNPIGHALLKKFKTLSGVFSASYDELCSVDGINEAGATLIMLIASLNNRISQSVVAKKTTLSNSYDAGEFCKKLLKGLTHERILVVSLNSLREVLAVDVVSDGTCNATTAEVRKVLEFAMLRKASAIMLCHNHIGDSANPSSSDIAATQKIINVLEGINISVIDHIICSEDSYVSMSERGMLDTPTVI